MAEKKEEKEKKPSDHFKKPGWDSVELLKDQIVSYEGRYPKPLNRYHLIYEAPHTSIEPIYFWCLSQFRGLGYPVVEKLTDLFSATESSSLFGSSQQRLGLSQDRVMQFLRVVHDMVRAIPPYMREIRTIRERLDYYENSTKEGDIGAQNERTLKGLFVDLVEGGAKNPGSVIGLSAQVGFTVLPDLFFKMKPSPTEYSKNAEGETVEYSDAFAKRVADLRTDRGGSFNNAVVMILERKLANYYTWKRRTEEELKWRYGYLLKYIRQYYSTIKLYMHWVRPYLKVIKNLGLDLGKNTQAELVRAFESSMVEIEVLARKAESDTEEEEGPYNCILMTFNYRTKPSMSFATPDYQHRGPVHVGEADITWRSYSWTEEDIEMFRKLKAEEDLDLLYSIDETLAEALKDVEGDFKEWLEKADEKWFGKKEEEEEKEKKNAISGFFEPIVGIGKGTKEGVSAIWKGSKEVIQSFIPEKKEEPKGGKGPSAAAAKAMCYLHYKNFKKSHGMVAW